MGVRRTSPNLVVALYKDQVTVVVFAAESITPMKMDSGIQQGCPLSGTPFALNLDRQVRRCIHTLTRASSRLCAFADDMGSATAQLAEQLQPITELFDGWAHASALAPNPAKCVLTSVGDSHAAQTLFQGILEYSSIHVKMHVV